MKSSFLIALTCLVAIAYASSASAATCTFEIIVKTDSRDDAGTDSRVSLAVSGASGPALSIKSLKPLGQMESRHNYFERGNVDRFTATGQCLRGRPFKILLTDRRQGQQAWIVRELCAGHPSWAGDVVREAQVDSESVAGTR